MGLAIIVMFLVLAGGGGYFAYASATDRSAKRVTAIASPQAAVRVGKATRLRERKAQEPKAVVPGAN